MDIFLKDFGDFLNQTIVGFTYKDVLIVIVFCLLGHLLDFISIGLINFFIKRTENRLAKIERGELDPKTDESKREQIKKGFWNYITKNVGSLHAEILKALRKPLHVFWWTAGCSIGLYIIDIPKDYADVFVTIFRILKAINITCISWFIINIIGDIVSPKVKERAANSETPIDEVLYPILITLSKSAVVVIAILIAFNIFGKDVSALLTGLGIGGAAIALASKDTIANIFGSIVILLDHPFVLGDWVTINGYEGNIAEIHLRTTKIKTFDDTIVSIPNSILSSTQIDTRGKYKSKMDCSFGVYYSTTPEQIQTIVDNIEAYINKQAVGPDRKYEPKHYVYFGGFGDSSLDITVVAYTHETSYKEHVKLKHLFMLEIIRIVNAAGTGFAFPTRTLDLPASPIKVEVNTSDASNALRISQEPLPLANTINDDNVSKPNQDLLKSDKLDMTKLDLDGAENVDVKALEKLFPKASGEDEQVSQ